MFGVTCETMVINEVLRILGCSGSALLLIPLIVLAAFEVTQALRALTEYGLSPLSFALKKISISLKNMLSARKCPASENCTIPGSGGNENLSEGASFGPSLSLDSPLVGGPEPYHPQVLCGPVPCEELGLGESVCASLGIRGGDSQGTPRFTRLSERTQLGISPKDPTRPIRHFLHRWPLEQVPTQLSVPFRCRKG